MKANFVFIPDYTDSLLLGIKQFWEMKADISVLISQNHLLSTQHSH